MTPAPIHSEEAFTPAAPAVVPGRRRSLASLLEAWPAWFLGLFTAVYFYIEICAVSRKGFFFDEIMTSYLGQLPDIRQIWPLIAKGIELNPPLPFWISWVLHHTLGDGEVISRIPALAGFWLMCFCLYHFVRRRCGIIFGFVAFLLPLFTFPAWDAAVARGYGPLLGMSALALLCWQLASDNVRRPWALAGLAFGIAGAVSCHYYAVYVAGAIGFGELVRSDVRRRIDTAIWIALVAGLSPLVAYAQLVRAAAAGAMKNFWVSASPQFLYDSYAGLLGPTMMVFLLFLAILLWPDRAGDREDNRTMWLTPTAPGAHEVAAGFLLLAMPFVFYTAGVVAGVPFYIRYTMPVTIGFTVILTMFAHRIGGCSIRFQRLLIALLVWGCLLPCTLWQTAKLFMVAPAAAAFLPQHPRLPLDSNLPIIFDSENDFIEYYFYGTPQLRSKIFDLVNRQASIRFSGTDTGMRSMVVAQTFRDLHTVDYHEFLANHREFIVARMREQGWVLQSLLADGAQVKLLSLKKDLGSFVQSNAFYHVSIPDNIR